MLFNSLEYLLFLPIVFLIYWLLNKQKLQYQNLFLLLVSYYFYSCWDWRFLFLLIFSTVLDYYTGIKMHQATNQKNKSIWFWLSAKKYLTFLIKRKKSIIEDLSWGKYKYLNRNKLDSILKNQNVKNEKLTNFKYSKYNLEYLDKILKICRENKINVYLVRSPVHHAWGALSNEYYFKKLINERYKKYEFLDFKDFPLDNNSYGDLSHLNHFGASKFSLFFNNLLKDKLLDKQDKQEFINVEMRKL